MANEITLLVNARPLVSAPDLDWDDRLVPGVHVLYVEGHIAPEHRANAGLDVFHSSIAISVLDDFQFDVIDPETGRVLIPSGEAEDYAHADEGEYSHLESHEPLEVAQVQVLGVEGGMEQRIVGEAAVAGRDWDEIQRRAIGLLWDEGLRTSGLTPVCERILADDQEEAAGPGERQ